MKKKECPFCGKKIPDNEFSEHVVECKKRKLFFDAEFTEDAIENFFAK